jgi:hypothetical protein
MVVLVHATSATSAVEVMAAVLVLELLQPNGRVAVALRFCLFATFNIHPFYVCP